VIGLAARVVLFVGLVVLAAFVPTWIDPFRAYELGYVGIYLIALLGLNILTGYTGQISLGQGAFMAIGGYTTAILMVDHGMKDVWTLPLAGLTAGVAGFLFGIPALRLRGPYLALATFAVAASLPIVLRYEKLDGFTHGSEGILLFGTPELTASITPLTVFGHDLQFEDWIYYVSWACAVVLFAIAWVLLRGRPGRAFRALRDSEVAAASSGVHPAAYKTLAFAVSSFYAGIAGGLYAMATTFVNPQTPAPVTLSLILLVGAVVAGLGSLWGILAGALLVQYLPDLAAKVSSEPGLPSVVYGGLLIALMLMLPGGVAGALRLLARPLTSRRVSRS
jgi:branched-chain amino acid transport system permease protein